MTTSNIHQQRKVKNYLLLGLLILIVICVFSITLVKLRFAENDVKGNRQEEYERVHNIKKQILQPSADNEKK